MLLKIWNKYKHMPLAVKAAAWFVICSMAQKCIGLITVPIFTRIMTSSQYGIYSAYMSVYNMMTIFCTLSMEKCAYINGIAKASDEKEKNSVAIPLLSLSFVITVSIFVLYLVFQNQVNRLTGLDTPLMIMMFVQIVFGPPVIFWSTKQRYEYKYIKLVCITLGMVLANAALGVLFVLQSEVSKQATARVFSIIIVQIILGMAFYIYFFRKAHCFFSNNQWKKTLSIQLPLLPHSLSLTVLSSSDRIMINSMIGSSQAAVYSIAYSAGYMVTILKDSIASAMTPWIYEKIKNKEYKDIRVLSRSVMLLVTLITFLFVSFAPEIVSVLAPEEYYEAIYVIPPVAASSFFTFVYNMFSNVGFYYEETKKIMSASIIGAVLNLVLNYLFIPIFGYVAAGYTTLVCYIVLAISHYVIMKKVCVKYSINEELFDIRYILIMSVVVVCVTICFSYVYSSMIIRYSILVVVLIVIAIYRNIFIDTFSIVKKRKA